MPEAEASTYRFNPFDLTKVWPYADYPLIEIGKLVLDRNPENYFADVEQAAFDPGNFVPGVGPSPDRCCRRASSRTATPTATASASTTRACRSTRHAASPAGATNYGRDGGMRFDGNGGRSKNYEPNSFDGPAQTDEPLYGRG